MGSSFAAASFHCSIVKSKYCCSPKRLASPWTISRHGLVSCRGLITGCRRTTTGQMPDITSIGSQRSRYVDSGNRTSAYHAVSLI